MAKIGRPKRERWEYRCAYRHHDGQVEGFVGFTISGTKDDARQDALSQIRRKLKIISEGGRAPKVEFDVANLITRFDVLSPEERDTIQRDWKTNVRY